MSSHQMEFVFEDFVARWFALQERLGRTADWIFTPYYDEDASAEQQFLAAAQAVEAVHEQLAPPDPGRSARAQEIARQLQLPAGSKSELPSVKRLVKGMLFRTTLEQRFHDVVEKVKDFAEVIAPDRRAFALRCADLRNYYAHWSDPRKEIAKPDVNELSPWLPVFASSLKPTYSQSWGSLRQT